MHNAEKRWKRQAMIRPSSKAIIKFLMVKLMSLSMLMTTDLFGYIVLTTSAGIMDHEEATRKNVGGKELGFFY
ncbi:hypothetical protein R6Q59_021211 [Mikania micrantha]